MQNLNGTISFDWSKWSTDIPILSEAEGTKKVHYFYNNIQFTLVLTENLNLSPHNFQTECTNSSTSKTIEGFFHGGFLNDLFFLTLERVMKIPQTQRGLRLHFL